MRIIIADDNKVIREEICEILKRVSDDIIVEKQFSNGLDALEWLRLNEVDLVISDIQMPKLNGIELIEAINNEGIDTNVVFLSCYEDFSYVKAALQNRAVDYILKPFSEEEAMNVIRKVYNELDGKEKNSQRFVEQQKEQILYKLLTLINISDDYKALAKNILPGECEEYFLICINYDDILSEYSTLLDTLKNTLDTSLDNVSHYYLVEIFDGELVVLYTGEMSVDEIFDIMLDFLNKLPDHLQNSVRVGISNKGNDILDIKASYKEAKKAVGYTAYNITQHIASFDTINKFKNPKINISKIALQVRELLENDRNEESVNEFIDAYLNETHLIDEKYVKNFTYLVIFSMESVLNENGYSLEHIDGLSIWDKIDELNTIVNVKMWIFNMFMISRDILERGLGFSKAELVNSIKKIIENNYSEKLSLPFIASKLHYSTNYLSLVFNELEHCSISSYVTSFKVEKIKDLLINTDTKIYKICEMVGYKNSDTFYRVFKKNTGCTPDEYRKKHKKGE